MKTRRLPVLIPIITTVAAVALVAGSAAVQAAGNAAPAAVQPASANQPVPPLAYGVTDVLNLVHANVGEDVIVNYIQGAGTGYGLDANQILYLKQQGVSDRILTTMLSQRNQPAPQANSSSGYSASTAQPAVTYVQPSQPSTVYVIPNSGSDGYYYPQSYNYYYSGWTYPVWYYPLGWCGYHGGYYYGGCYGGHYGGYYGGWHGSGGWHGGGGSWHGGGGGHGGGHH